MLIRRTDPLEGTAVARLPLFRSAAPPMTDEQRRRLVHQARRTLAERTDLSPGHKARGLLALHKAAERLSQSSSPQATRPAIGYSEPNP